jgi:release factor glutamine methyltransferase
MSEHQAPLAKAVLLEHGLTAHITSDDERGATVVRGTNPTI